MAESALRQLVQQQPWYQTQLQNSRSGIGLSDAAMARQAVSEQVANQRDRRIADYLAGGSMATMAVPVVGDLAGAVSDAAMFYAKPEERTLGNLGMALAGIVPGIPAASAMRAAREGLDMSQAARMQRADDQGFYTNMPLYHATNQSFDAFEIPERGFLKYGKGVYTSPSPKYSDRYIQLEGSGLEPAYNEGANVMPVYVRGKIATEKDWEAARQEMLSEGTKPAGYNPMQEEIKRHLQAKGFDGLNMFGNEVVIYDPANIRSINAAFDPAKRGSSNLMAGVAGTAVTGSALRALVPQEQERKPD